jgi:hypothetical protein
MALFRVGVWWQTGGRLAQETPVPDRSRPPDSVLPEGLHHLVCAEQASLRRSLQAALDLAWNTLDSSGKLVAACSGARFPEWLCFFTANPDFYPGGSTRTQTPVPTIQGHVTYQFRPRPGVAVAGGRWDRCPCERAAPGDSNRGRFGCLPSPPNVRRCDRAGLRKGRDATHGRSSPARYVLPDRAVASGLHRGLPSPKTIEAGRGRSA